MLAVVPRFIDSRLLRETVWAIAEAVLPPIIERLERIMTLVSIDSDVLASLTTLAQTVDSEVKSLIAAGTLAPGDASGIQTALADANSALSAAANPAPVDTSTPPADTSTPPADDSTDTGTPVDPSAPADGGTVSTDDPSVTS